MSAELDRAVRTVVRQCMGVSPGEDVLVVCNPVTEEIGALMRIEAQGDGADATLAVISERDSAAAEPPRAVAAAMAAVKDHENSPLSITEFPHPPRLPPGAL